jgi:hypothetical protein
MNNLIDYFIETEPWPEKVRKLKSKYNFSIHRGEVDLSLEEAKTNKRRYKFPSVNDKKVNYYQYGINGNQYLSIARTFDWSHKDNDAYWKEETIEGAYEKNNKVPYLIEVCWLDTKFSFFNVKPNNYKLYINEHFIKSHHFVERVLLKIIIDENITIYEKKFPDEKTFENNSSEEDKYSMLNEDFICYVKMKDFEKAKKNENGDCVVNVVFDHANDSFWKEGWFIDGGSLKEITEKEMEDEIKNINDK